MLAGGGKLRIRHGRHLDYNALAGREGFDYRAQPPGTRVRICHKPVNPKARMCNLLLTIAQKMDVPVERFGDSSAEAGELLG